MNQYLKVEGKMSAPLRSIPFEDIGAIEVW